MDKQVQQGIVIVPGSLTAILEKPPGQPGAERFLVIVDVRADAGCALDLVAATPGINPLLKFVRIQSDPLPSPPAGAAVRRTLRYEELPPAADYKEVWLGEGDAAISVKVALVM